MDAVGVSCERMGEESNFSPIRFCICGLDFSASRPARMRFLVGSGWCIAHMVKDGELVENLVSKRPNCLLESQPMFPRRSEAHPDTRISIFIRFLNLFRLKDLWQ